MKNLYTPEGWLNVDALMKLKTPFIFVVGGRGIGKTYGALQYTLKNDITFMLTRRTQKQADLISIPELSPLKTPCADMHIDYTTKNIVKDCAGVFIIDSTGEKRLRGYTTGLSTISSLRGFDVSDVTLWIFDEFIPERHERPIRYEGEAFLNAYETINRNRELSGNPPLKALCLSNANDVGNPIFAVLGLCDIARKMQERGQSVYINEKRGIAIIRPTGSPISTAKKDTALYKAAGDGRFMEMALTNAFEKEPCIESRNISEYVPMVSCGNMYFYKHKSTPETYCTSHRSGTPEHFDMDSTSISQFKAANGWLKVDYLLCRLIFETVELKRTFENIFF